MISHVLFDHRLVCADRVAGGSAAHLRAIKDGRLRHLWERGGNRALVLLIGAGDGSALFLREPPKA